MNADLHALVAVRGRAAYWQKRIEMEKSARRQQQLFMFAWAEIGRMVMTNGAQAYQAYSRSAATFEAAMLGAFEVALRQIGSRRKTPSPRRARAADTRR